MMTLSSVMMKRKKIKGMISRIWNSASLIIFQNYRKVPLRTGVLHWERLTC